MLDIKGIITPIVTPFNEDETVNEQELRNQVNRQIEAGIYGIFPLGTNGEGYILDDNEKEHVLQIVINEAKGRIPIYAGTGCVSTRDTIRLSKIAETLGADVLSLVTPYYAAASQEELYEHYKAVAEAVDLPILLYNIPARAGNSIAPATIAKLSKIDNIVGAKDSSGDFENLKQYIELTDDNFAVLSGNDSLILPSLMAGGRGGIAGCANVYPKNMISIYNSFIAGEIEAAQKAQDAVKTLRAVFKYGNPNTIIKKATSLLGYNVGDCRRPFNRVSEEAIKALRIVIEENDRLGLE